MTEQDQGSPTEAGDATTPDDPAVQGDDGHDQQQAELTGEAQQATGPQDSPIPPDEQLARGEVDDTALEEASSGEEPHGQAAQEAAGGVSQGVEPQGVGAEPDPPAHDATDDGAQAPDDGGQG